MKIKKSTKIFIFIFEIIFILLFFIILFLYQKGFDTLVFYTPENTGIYLNLNYSNYTKPGSNFLKFLNNKNILNIKELENIKKYYQKEISFFIDENNNFGFILRKNINGKNKEVNIEELKRFINNYLSIESNLFVKEYEDLVYISNIEDIKIKKYEYFKNNYKDYLAIYLLKNNNFIKGLISNQDFKNILKDIDFKDEKIKIIGNINKNNNLELNIANSNYKNIKNIPEYNIETDYNDYLLLNNLNLLDLYENLYKLSKNNNNFRWLMDLKANFEDRYKFNQEKLDNILNNTSDIYISFKDKKINKFCILFNLENLNYYIDEIINIKDIFLQHAAIEDPEIKEIKLEDGTFVKELIMNTKNVQFKELYKDQNKEIYNLNIRDNGEVFYSLIEGKYFSISNDFDLIKNINKEYNNEIIKLNIKNKDITIESINNVIRIVIE